MIRHKKIKRILFKGNSERNLILRLEFVKQMIQILDTKVNIIKIDETSGCQRQITSEKIGEFQELRITFKILQ
jgi:hypothetical protein